MPIIATIDINSNKIISVLPQEYKEVILEGYSINDTLVIDESTKDIVTIQKSTQGKKRIEELQLKKELDLYESIELDFLLS